MTKRPDGITIRDAREDERETIRQLTMRAYEEYAEVMTPSAWAGLREAVVEALASDLPAERIVAERDGELVGSVMLFPPDTGSYGEYLERSNEPELRMLAVAEQSRGQGVGRALVAECIERARRQGATALGLHTSDSLAVAIKLYEQMGFERDPENDFQLPGSEVVKAYRLVLG